MVHVPVVSNEAVELAVEAVHTDGVVEVKLTVSPELAVAVNGTKAGHASDCVGMESKLMVCGALPVPVPLNPMLWVV